MSLLLFIIILVVLVWVHELGHLSAAKLLGIKVEEFNVGFPPRIVSFWWGETRYSLNWLLLGGYVSIYGETDDPEVAADPRSFVSKPRPAQAAVIVAGIIFNILFAWLVLTGGYIHGLPSSVVHDGWGQVTDAKATVVTVLPGSPAAAAGIESGDTVIAVETAAAQAPAGADASTVHDFLTSHAADSIALRLMRQGVEKDFIVKAAEGVVAGRKALGVELDDVGTLALPPQLAVLQAAVVSKNILVAEASALGGLVKGYAEGQGSLSDVSGPIGIVSVGSQLVSQGFGSTVTIIALISINLALINILPIPGLDGGRLLFIVIESIIRRPLSRRLSTALTLAGMALIVLLMLIVSANDIAKLIG